MGCICRELNVLLESGNEYDKEVLCQVDQLSREKKILRNQMERVGAGCNNPPKDVTCHYYSSITSFHQCHKVYLG